MPTLLLQNPSSTSKTVVHIKYLERRLDSWEKGDINALVEEGRSIQCHLKPRPTSRKVQTSLANHFAKLMFKGGTAGAIHMLSSSSSGGVLHLHEQLDSTSGGPATVLDALTKKHPSPQSPSSQAVIPGEPPLLPHPAYYDCLTANTIRQAALRTKGSAGPSGLSAWHWRRICTSFKSASSDLCHSLALVCRRLCTTYVDPRGLAPLLVCRLIALDKCPGVRPIGVCETVRRVISKAILMVTKDDLREAAGALQLCAGQTSGIEAAIHAVRSTFSDDESEAILLVDASNAFNYLNKQVALRNVRHLCPSIATVLINTYRSSSELLVDNQVLWSQEGTTQGDPLAMPFYALATFPLINSLPLPTSLHHIWYADDASACGKVSDIYSWWSTLVNKGSLYGWFPNSSKTYLVVKKDHLDTAKDVFCDSNIQITTSGRPLLGAAIGSEEFIESFIQEKVATWLSELSTLASFAASQPHAAYCAFTHGFVHKFNFICRVQSNICNLLQPVEDFIAHSLVPVLTGRPPIGSIERDLVALPVRLGGLGLPKITEIAKMEYDASREISQPLSDIIVCKNGSTGPENDPIFEQFEAKSSVVRKKKSHLDHLSSTLRDQLPPSLQLAMDLAREKGASASLPLEEFGFTLHKGGFRDALSLRYGWIPPNLPSTCECGSPFSIEHSLSCPRGASLSLDTMKSETYLLLGYLKYVLR